MQIRLSVFSLVLAAFLSIDSDSVVALTCSGLAGTLASPSTVVSGNTCGSNTLVTNICNGSTTLNGAGMDIYELDIGAEFPIEALRVTSTTFTPQLAVIGGACNTDSSCIVSQTIPGSGTVTVQLGPSPPAGTYFVFVGDVITQSPGCGSYQLATMGFVPVRLQSFEVD